MPLHKHAGYQSLSKAEAEICERFRRVRFDKKLSQAAFGDLLGISRSRVSNYEYSQSAIPYSVGELLCEKYDISQRWLATGVPPGNGVVRFDSQRFPIDPRMRFSEAYYTFLHQLPEFSEQDQTLKLSMDSMHDQLAAMVRVGVVLTNAAGIDPERFRKQIYRAAHQFFSSDSFPEQYAEKWVAGYHRAFSERRLRKAGGQLRES